MRVEELRTPGGRVVKIRLDRMTAVVFGSDNKPEVVRHKGRESMEQPIPAILFVGADFKAALEVEVFRLVENRGGRLRIPYKTAAGQVQQVGIACASASDAFPVFVRHCDTVKDFLAADNGTVAFQYMVVSSELARMDTVALRVRYPDAQILVVKAPTPAADTHKMDASKVRASDLAKTEQGRALSGNPVFLARIHLRLLELDRVRELLTSVPIGPEEVDFVRTFLDLMIRNDQNRSELAAARGELDALNRLYEAAALLLRRDSAGLRTRLEALGPKDRGRLALLAGRRSDLEDSDKVAELEYWGLQILLEKAGTSV